MSRPRVIDAVFVESFHGGSHAAFADGWMRHSRHRWRLLRLPAERWQWRMRTAGMALAPRLAALSPTPRVVVASGLLDLAHLRQLSGLDRSRRPPAFLLYMHENQFSYPRPPGTALDRSHAGAHIASWLAADAAAWNSGSHRRQAAERLKEYLGEIPPPRPRGLARVFRGPAAPVLPPGVDLDGFPQPAPRPAGDPPLIAWNHRWDGDKRPGAFARVMLRLAEKGRRFRLLLLGPLAIDRPEPLERLRRELGPRIVHAGPARTRRQYLSLLRRADLTVSTASQENFGYAAVEAMAAGAVPLFPDRLSYPELLPASLRPRLLYRTDRELASRLGAWLAEPTRFAPLRPAVMRAARRHAWPARARALDDWVEEHAG